MVCISSCADVASKSPVSFELNSLPLVSTIIPKFDAIAYPRLHLFRSMKAWARFLPRHTVALEQFICGPIAESAPPFHG